MLFTSLYSNKAQLFLLMLIFWSSYFQETIIDRVRAHKKRGEEIKRRVGMVLSPCSSTCSLHNMLFLSLDMKRRNLENISQEEDGESSKRNLTDQLAKLNDQRLQAVIKLKASTS